MPTLLHAEFTELDQRDPDEACEVICKTVAEQFWDWLTDPARGRRFKPRVKLYETR